MKSRWLVLLALCLLVLLILVPVATRKAFQRRSSSKSLASTTVAYPKPLPAYLRSLRPNYPYSVVPGGVYSPAELRFANTKDNAVRAHYSDFNLQSAHMVKLTADRDQYVSYRVKNQIYWTAKKLRIPKGEYLLTDGVNFARARCGNRLSDVPQQQVSRSEPVPDLLSPAVLPPQSLANVDLTTAPSLPPESGTPDSSPRLAPALPADVSVSSPNYRVGMPVGPSAGSQIASGAPITQQAPVPPFGGASAPSSFSNASDSSTQQPPITIPAETPIGPSPVPEPSTVYLFLITFSVALWAFTRLVASDEKKSKSN